MNQATRKSGRLRAFVRNDHRYVFLGGGLLALVCLALISAAPSEHSFLGTDNFICGLLTGICCVFLAAAALALIVKLTHWKTYGGTFLKKPGPVRAARIYSYVLAAVFALLAADRLAVKLADTVRMCAAMDSNPPEFFLSMFYMTSKSMGTIAYGVKTTVFLALAGTAIAFVLGILMAFFRIQTPDKRDNDFVKFLKSAARTFASFYITVIRGTPMMVQALIIFFAGFNVFTHFTDLSVAEINRIWSTSTAGLITISLNSTAYLAEVLRGGMESVDVGQTEAARSLGMTGWQAMLKVVFPQAVKNSIPAIGNEFIINIKDSSVLSVIGCMDLMFATKSVSGIYYRQLEIYCMAAILYLILTYLSSLLLRYLSRKLDMPNTRGIPSSN